MLTSNNPDDSTNLSEYSPYVSSDAADMRGFKIIPNDLLRNKYGLSIGALGFICYLLSNKADFKVYDLTVMKTFDIGVKKLRSLYSELKLKGFIRRERIKNEKGWIVGHVTRYSNYPEFLHEKTIGAQKGSMDGSMGSKNHRCPKGSSPESAPNKTNNKNNTSFKNKTNIDHSDDFEIFWKQYPCKKGKQKAKQLYAKVIKTTSKELLEKALQDQARERATKAQWGMFVPEWPHASTWLSQARYDDEVQSDEEIVATASTIRLTTQETAHKRVEEARKRHEAENTPEKIAAREQEAKKREAEELEMRLSRFKQRLESDGVCVAEIRNNPDLERKYVQVDAHGLMLALSEQIRVGQRA